MLKAGDFTANCAQFNSVLQLLWNEKERWHVFKVEKLKAERRIFLALNTTDIHPLPNLLSNIHTH